jgi:hypothetical protein
MFCFSYYSWYISKQKKTFKKTVITPIKPLISVYISKMLNYNYTFDGNNTDSSTILLFLIHFNFVSRFDRVKYVFGIMVAFIIVVWKKLFYKKYFWLGLVWYLYMFG